MTRQDTREPGPRPPDRGAGSRRTLEQQARGLKLPGVARPAAAGEGHQRLEWQQPQGAVPAEGPEEAPRARSSKAPRRGAAASDAARGIVRECPEKAPERPSCRGVPWPQRVATLKPPADAGWRVARVVCGAATEAEENRAGDRAKEQCCKKGDERRNPKLPAGNSDRGVQRLGPKKRP